MGKSASMAIFNSFLYVYQRVIMVWFQPLICPHGQNCKPQGEPNFRTNSMVGSCSPNCWDLSLVLLLQVFSVPLSFPASSFLRNAEAERGRGTGRDEELTCLFDSWGWTLKIWMLQCVKLGVWIGFHGVQQGFTEFQWGNQGFYMLSPTRIRGFMGFCFGFMVI